MGKKQKKKPIRRKEIFQRTWILEIKGDESDSDWDHSLKDLSGTNNSE